MADALIGSADDYLVRVLTEAGAEVTQSTIQHIAIEDHNLAGEARSLPNLLFYYAAAYQRMSLKMEQTKIELKETEARETIRIQEEQRAAGTRMNAEEVASRVCLCATVGVLKRRVVEIDAAKETVDAVSSALRQKGYSLQLIGSIRLKEDDWLRMSFARRLEGNPNRDKILAALDQLSPQTR